MNVQIIEKNGKPEWAVIPYSEYQKMRQTVEDACWAQEAVNAEQGGYVGTAQSLKAVRQGNLPFPARLPLPFGKG